MSETPVVYIVTSGEYSDYRIRGVYLDRNRAEERKDFLNHGANWPVASIETWASDGTRKGGVHYNFWAGQSDWKPGWSECDGADYPEPEVDAGTYWIEVDSNDFDRGLKALHDAIAEAKAREAGIG